ncbi:MAG: monoterpene epsilon-lactone hydrolase [Myxococcota bacterium]|jgi:monoterpene epsilon-lactone hydrolase
MITALLRVAWAWTIAWLTVPLRRLVRGPARPGWSLRYEVLAHVMRHVAGLTMSHPLPVIRRLWDASARLAPASGPREVADCPDVHCEWFGPAGTDSVVLYLHGGAYVLGSTVAYRDACSRLARESGARVLAPDYRLAPEHPHPAALDDALAAYRWLVETCGISPRDITVGGDSAGGGLTLALLTALRDSGAPLPARAVLISPWADVQGAGGSDRTNAPYDYVPEGSQVRFGKMYAGDRDMRDPAVSPVYADLTGLPPMLVMVGGAERLLDVGCGVADRAEACGVTIVLEVHDDMIHAWPLFAPVIPESRAAWRRVGAWVREPIRS